MYIHNPVTAVIYRFICLFLCGYGLFINALPLSPSHILHMLSYFTILTNLLCLYVYIKCIFISSASMLSNELTKYNSTLIFFKGLATVSAVVSCIAYHYVLRKNGLAYTIRGLMIIESDDFFVHYIVPFVTVTDWLLFQPKGLFKWKYIGIWMFFPLIYFAFSMLRYGISGNYPYYFMNINRYGIRTFIFTIFLIAILCLITGTLLVCLDFFINKYFPVKGKK